MSNYVNNILSNVINNQALTVLGSGMGYDYLITKVLTHFCRRTHDHSKLFFVLNGTNDFDKYQTLLLSEGDLDPVFLPQLLLSETCNTSERMKIFSDERKGNVFFVSSRILIQDLLRQNLNLQRVRFLGISTSCLTSF